MIFAYQYLHGNVNVNLSWNWVTPLSQLQIPASSVRGNKHARLNPGIVKNPLRANVIGVRLATPLNSLPATIMEAKCVNDFKNATSCDCSAAVSRIGERRRPSAAFKIFVVVATSPW